MLAYFSRQRSLLARCRALSARVAELECESARLKDRLQKYRRLAQDFEGPVSGPAALKVKSTVLFLKPDGLQKCGKRAAKRQRP